jgi:hypothetical protein
MGFESIMFLVATLVFFVGIFISPAPNPATPFYARLNFMSAGLFCCALAWFLVSMAHKA